MSKRKKRDIVPGNIDDIELGWLAGLWEGEGTFGYSGSTQKASLEMCDKGVVERQKALIERIFKINPPTKLVIKTPNKLGHHDTYRTDFAGPTARAIMRLLIPLMGSRRRAQIWRALNEVPEKRVEANIIDLVKAPMRGANENH